MATGQRTLLITGATGFVGGQIVREALEKGYHVRMAVRSKASAKKAISYFPEHAAQLSSVTVPDITKVESYKDALGGITGIIHTASPFVLNPEDNVKDLLEPAINGSVAILEAAKRWGPSVTRVVVTSSFASIVDLNQGTRAGYTYDEKDWNPMTFEEASKADGVTAYCASKALAEKVMWDWAEKNKPQFGLVAICPPWVFGPYAHELRDTKHLGESLAVMWGIAETKEIPPFDFGGCADSRDVAAAHILALEAPEAAGQRFLVGQSFRYQTAVDIARDKFPQLGLPKGNPGYVEPAYALDGSKASRILGLKYRALAETVTDMYGQLLNASQIEQSA
ncbi:hypothetical protein DL762_005396 [Monosporascus cannonballus]|uniref:NAD-dependent epimerase/dehydratase domain-containing protein n=1 Tax=Monosporascus cannonballus TaxID=155416 RepID=A0ABY0H501_9PEZI|nr:hypothetical protein DL762_005396 [Monosporascus cannonballus]